MDRPERPRIDQLEAELNLWNTYCEIRLEKGFDFAAWYAKWARETHEGLTSPGGREDFGQLCRAGCLPQGLATLVSVLRNAPILERFWTEEVGKSDSRARAMQSLENAARTLESLHSDVISRGEIVEAEEFSKIGRIPISRLANELRIHAKVVNLAELLKKDTEARSASEVARYLLTAYVHAMTGRFHDQSVSGLVGEILKDTDNYNDVAQRMWRSRNYERLDSHYSWIVKFLVAMSVVIKHTA